MRLPRHTVLYTGIILIALLLLLLSCGGTEDPRLEGTWTLTTESNGGDPVGNGTYELTFTSEVPELNTYFYTGTAELTVNDVTTEYQVSVERKAGGGGSDFYLYLCDNLTIKFTNSIKMIGKLDGSSSASGSYEGIGTEATGTRYVDFGTGSFFTRKVN